MLKKNKTKAYICILIGLVLAQRETRRNPNLRICYWEPSIEQALDEEEIEDDVDQAAQS